MSFNLNNCTSDCKICIQSYIKKHRLGKGDKFQIKCSGIPQEYIPKELLSEVEDQESSLAILDPVTWAAKYLDWHCIDPDGSVWKRKTEDGTLKEVYPYNEEIAKAGKSPYNRPYQATILRCSSRRKVFRCVDPETKITLKNGSTKRVVDLKIADEIISIDDNTFQPKVSKIIDIFSSGIKKRYKIKTKQGHEVIVSEDHPFLVKKGRVDKKNGYNILDISSEWQSIKTGLKIQSRIAICNYLNNEIIQDNPEITDDHLKILGYFITDGSYGIKQSAKFTNNNLSYLKEFESSCKKLGSQCKWYKKNKGYDLIISNGRFAFNPVTLWLKSIGCKDVVFENRLLPNFIFSLSKRQIGLLLNRMWAGDGWVEKIKRKNRNTHRCSLGIASTSLEYLSQVKALLLKCGIGSYIRIEKNSYVKGRGKRNFYKLHISKSADIIKFFNLTGEIFGKEEQSRLGIQIANQNLNSKLQIENCVTWDHVKSIEELPPAELYDLSLDSVHTFIANSSIILHNCGRQMGKTKSLEILAAFNICTNDNLAIVLIAPYQSQIELFFSELIDMIKDSKYLSGSIRTSKKQPNHYLELMNGSSVIGFTAGSKSKAEAGASRGQHANMIIFDECFIGESKLNTLEGIKTIEDINIGDKVYSFDKQNNKSFQTVVDKKCTGQKQVKKYIFENKDYVVCTPNHPILNNDNFTNIDDAKYGYISEKPRNCNKDIIEASLYGMILSDGWATIDKHENEVLGFSGSIEGLNQIKEDIKILLGYEYGSQIFSRQTESKDYGIKGKTNSFVCGQILWNILKKYNFPIGKKVYQSYQISPLIMGSDNIEITKAFLATLFGAEGTTPSVFNKDGKRLRTISIAFTKIKELENELKIFFDQIGQLLDKLDIQYCIKKYYGKIKTEDRVKYELRIKNDKQNLRKFFENISYRYDPRKSELAFLLSNYIKIWPDGRGIGKQYPKFWDFVSERFQDKWLRLKIIEKKFLGERKVYNLTIEKNNTFIVENLAVHNCDMLSPKDIDAALAIITNFPDATVCMSSTPTGKRERFFETCKSKNFKEFHFSSWVNPNYTPELDALYREQLTEMGYQHEIEALFGSQEEGVYQLRHIEVAETRYEISEMKPSPDWVYTMGVDWNSSKYGTTIAVIGFNIKESKFRLVDKKTVKKDGWTQLAACETIAEMNRYWNPLAIYVDRGYGHMQVEILQKFGHDALIDKTKGPKHPDARLATILKYYDFGGSVEVRDPFTNKMVKKPAKPFLVENSVRRFETQSFQIPKNDEMLKRALIGYRIKRVSEAGVPVYEQADSEAGDHMLDAINLSLVAFTLENTDFGKKKTTFGLTISDTNIFPNKEDKETPKGIIDRSMPTINRGIPAANTTDNINSQGIIWHGFWNDEPKPSIKKDNLKRSTLFQRPGYKKRSNI